MLGISNYFLRNGQTLCVILKKKKKLINRMDMLSLICNLLHQIERESFGNIIKLSMTIKCNLLKMNSKNNINVCKSLRRRTC